MASSEVAGVDWGGDGWFAVFYQERSYAGHSFEQNFEDLWSERNNTELALVDVPIGLPDDQSTLAAREALDSKARQKCGQPSSVFPVPSRAACKLAYQEGAPYEEVSEQQKADLGKGLTKQSYHISKGIGEVDAYLQATDSATEWILESHPEICFRELRGGPLEFGKDCAPGIGERLAALEDHLRSPGESLAEITASISNYSSTAEIDQLGIDDVLDAMVLGVTAAKGSDALEYLSVKQASDSVGFPMQMAYWSRESGEE